MDDEQARKERAEELRREIEGLGEEPQPEEEEAEEAGPREARACTSSSSAGCARSRSRSRTSRRKRCGQMFAAGRGGARACPHPAASRSAELRADGAGRMLRGVHVDVEPRGVADDLVDQ